MSHATPVDHRHRWLGAGLLAVTLILVGCDEPTPHEFSSPGNSYATYVERLLASDVAGTWSCFAEAYRESRFGGRHEGWEAEFRQTGTELQKQARRREIVEERTIGDRIGFVRFDPTTLAGAKSSQFFYFIREAGGWKVTSYLDSTFHAELENAIERGEFDLPTL